MRVVDDLSRNPVEAIRTGDFPSIDSTAGVISIRRGEPQRWGRPARRRSRVSWRPSAADRLPPPQEWMTTFMQSGLIDFNRPSRESVK
jgi:hypothetical protein